MQQAQADKLDHWQLYPVRNVREEIAKSALTQLPWLMGLSGLVGLGIHPDALIKLLT